MSYTGVYDKTIYYNPVSKYCVISVKTNDQSIPQKARSAFQHRDRLIRFTAVGYELPQTDRVSMILNGEKNGRQDDEFIKARRDAAEKRSAAKSKGAPRIGEFCSAWSALELRDVITRRLSRIPMLYDEWRTHFEGKSKREISRMPKSVKIAMADGKEKKIRLTKKNKAILGIISALEERVFTPEMMMYDDSSSAWRRAPLMPSPEEKIVEKRRANYIPTIVFAVMTAFLVFKFSASPTWSTAIYCLFKLFGLVWRGGVGYSIGFLAYSVHGVKYYQSIELRFNEYEEWLKTGGDENVFDF